MAARAAEASRAVHGARCGLLACGVTIRRSNGLSSMRPSSYAARMTARRVRLVRAGADDASTTAFTRPWVSAESGTSPMKGRTLRSIWLSYWASVAALRGVPRFEGARRKTPR